MTSYNVGNLRAPREIVLACLTDEREISETELLTLAESFNFRNVPSGPGAADMKVLVELRAAGEVMGGVLELFARKYVPAPDYDDRLLFTEYKLEARFLVGGTSAPLGGASYYDGSHSPGNAAVLERVKEILSGEDFPLN